MGSVIVQPVWMSYIRHSRQALDLLCAERLHAACSGGKHHPHNQGVETIDRKVDQGEIPKVAGDHGMQLLCGPLK